jgi:hypothetical protein
MVLRCPVASCDGVAMIPRWVSVKDAVHAEWYRRRFCSKARALSVYRFALQPCHRDFAARPA